MSTLTLVIGNRNYSSWSLRPWLVLKQAGIPFDELRIALYREDSKQQLAKYSPTGKAPVLLDGDAPIWDSLAICEYLAERFPEKRLWPAEPRARAVARAVSAEMHSGFAELRTHMSMNIRRSLPGRGMIPEVRADIDRILDLWRDCRREFGAGGTFLFGAFGIADAMYAPVALRFQTYAVALEGQAAVYAATLLALPALQEWCARARAETEFIPRYEPG